MPHKPYPELTFKSAKRAANWLLDELGMEDWRVSLDIRDVVPRWRGDDEVTSELYGSVIVERHTKHMQVWVSNMRALRGGRDPLAGLFHEMLHAAFDDANLKYRVDDGPVEFLLTRLADIAAAAYRARGRKR